MNEKTILRARDFWASIILICVTTFFIFQTSDIPFFNAQAAGVDAAKWYNSAALVPYAIFGTLLILAFFLLGISIKDGGAKHALSRVGLRVSGNEFARVTCIICILFFYIFGLVPRVDFIISSSLLITCLVWGFHTGNRAKMFVCTLGMATAGAYAMIVNFPISDWAKPHDDDWVALLIFLSLTAIMIFAERKNGPLTRVVKITPVLSIIAPLVLVMAMAFGFRQNVPNRSGLLFSQIEYHYFVTLKPIWNKRQ